MKGNQTIKIILKILVVALAGYFLYQQYVVKTESELVSYKDLIKVESPRPNEIIESPLIIRGQARGNWFFEATFPIVLVDWDGRIIAEHYAQAQVDPADDGAGWMTTEYVPFEAILEFQNPAFPGTDRGHFSHHGALILQKDNPSGLPEHADAFEIPIRFE